jgi:hypothetical protein
VPEEAKAVTDADAVAAVVRDYMRAHVLELLERKGLAGSAELEACPRCGERTIHPAVPASFAVDRRDRARICAACSAVGDVMRIMLPRFEHDVGGEGEGEGG